MTPIGPYAGTAKLTVVVTGTVHPASITINIADTTGSLAFQGTGNITGDGTDADENGAGYCDIQ